ncbi:very long chain fatty acid elongase 1-like [Ornithodoros turicata]|uniref:very long chain fatty acid elongase 1-like n=1 Tax=Ornithodoros turicata TaxID=34597 RepID=UPI0031392976
MTWRFQGLRSNVLHMKGRPWHSKHNIFLAPAMNQSTEINLHQYYILLADSRTRSWPLMGSPVPIASIIAFYLLFATHLGPRLMRDHKPLNIRRIVCIYNVIMVCLSFYFIYISIQYVVMFKGGYLLCLPSDSRASPENMYFLTRAWYYLLMKAGEMLDTAFFVLMKKDSHLSFLHILHHSLALWSVWLTLTIGVTGQVYSFPLLNSAVHVVMYSYYAMAAMGPSVKRHLWWKKYVTLCQIAQFVLLSCHALIPVFVDCGFPKFLSAVGALEGFLFAALFSDFYYTRYVRKVKKVT